MRILMAELAKKLEEGTYPITMEASIPKIGTKPKVRMRHGERLKSRKEGN